LTKLVQKYFKPLIQFPILGQIVKPVSLKGAKLILAGSLYDVYLFRREGIPDEAPIVEKYGGFEMGLVDAMSKHLGFSYHVTDFATSFIKHLFC